MLYMIGAFLVFVLFLLVVIIFVLRKSKPAEGELSPKKDPASETVDSFIKILKTEKKDLGKIEGLVEKMAKEFPFPENENEAKKYYEFVYFYAKNPLSTAKMIVQMQKILSRVNPKYAKQIEDFQMRGVDARNTK